MDTTAADTRKRDLVEETERARDAAVQALNARLTVEEEAERWKARAQEALQAQRAAAAEAERARLAAAEAEQRRLAAEEETERARLAAEEALQTWRASLSKEAEGAPATTTEAAPQTELNETLREQVVDRTAEVEPPAAPARYLTCSISYRREYRKVAFYAHAFDEDGSELIVAVSPHFRARGSGPPERTDQAVAAHRDLVDQLVAEGWVLADDGEAWFEKTFRRRVASSVE